MKQIFNFTNIAPHYRKALWLKLLNDNENKFHFYYGGNIKSGIKPIDFSDFEFKSYCEQLHLVKNYWINGRILLWQKGVLKACIRKDFDHAIFLSDMYCISTWLALIVCRFRGIPVALWGHGIYGSESKIKLAIRLFFRRLANKHLLYERRAKKLLISKGFDENSLYVVFNSLDYNKHINLRTKIKKSKKEVYHFFADSSLPILVFIGRLTSSKKIDMLIRSVLQLNVNTPKVNLMIIGDGPKRYELEVLAKKNISIKTIYFRGECYNEEEIGEYLYHADLCVSPGNVGLTAIHSLSFGTPVVTHNNWSNQGPEVESITEGINGFFFKENDENDLKNKILKWFETHRNRKEIRNQCYEIIDEFYNPNYQSSVFKRLLNNQIPKL